MIHDPPTLRSFSRDHAREPPTIANLVSRETHFYHVSEIPMATFTSMQEIVSKNNIGRRYTRFVSRGKCALLRDNTLLCGRRAGYVMVVGRFEKLIHTSELRIKPLSAISYIIVYIYIFRTEIFLYLFTPIERSLFLLAKVFERNDRFLMIRCRCARKISWITPTSLVSAFVVNEWRDACSCESSRKVIGRRA